MSDPKTETLYEGETDARQADVVVGLFRTRYRKLSEAEVAMHDRIKHAADVLSQQIGALNPAVLAKLMGVPISSLPHDCTGGAALLANKMYDGAGVTLALRHLEDAVYRAVKALTA